MLKTKAQLVTSAIDASAGHRPIARTERIIQPKELPCTYNIRTGPFGLNFL
jgi:hypothetical protein